MSTPRKHFRVFLRDVAEQSVLVQAESNEEARNKVQHALDNSGDPFEVGYGQPDLDQSEWEITESYAVTPDMI